MSRPQLGPNMGIHWGLKGSSGGCALLMVVVVGKGKGMMVTNV